MGRVNRLETASKSLPSPPQRFPFQHLIAFTRDRLGFLQRLAKDYGDIVAVPSGPRYLVLLNHPEYIKDVLVTHSRNFIKGYGLQRAKRLLGNGLLTSEGEFHVRQRRLVRPAFHRERIAAYAQVMTSYAARMIDRWRDGERLDVAAEMSHLTLAIATKTLFNAEVQSEAAAEITEAVNDLTTRHFEHAMLPYSHLFDSLPVPWNIAFKKVRARLDARIYRLIAERRALGQDLGDLLSMLMLARDEEGDGGQMSDEQIRDEVVTLWLAGHETTGNALSWTWYLLSQNPQVESQLHAELEKTLRGRLPTVDDVAQLVYTRMVLAESMRLYPPAWVIGYQALEDHRFGEYTVPGGSFLLMSQYLMHRDPRYYEDPERFAPERWTPELESERPRFSYFPFGGGPRQCIGEQFAWMEGIFLLAVIAQHWRLRIAPGHRVEVNPVFTLRPKGGLPMTVHLH
jgi:cytochrome P450